MAEAKHQIHPRLSPELIKALDAFAEQHGISRNAALAVLLSWAIRDYHNPRVDHDAREQLD
jgi:hypothetical protein